MSRHRLRFVTEDAARELLGLLQHLIGPDADRALALDGVDVKRGDQRAIAVLRAAHAAREIDAALRRIVETS